MIVSVFFLFFFEKVGIWFHSMPFFVFLQRFDSWKQAYSFMKLKFFSLCSGSSGNCFYLGTSSYGILIDSGIGIRSVRKILRERGIAIESVLAVFVTHDHADHIRSVGNISGQFNIPVYTTSVIHEGIRRNYCATREVPPANRRYLVKGEPVQVRDFVITPFEIPHDGTDNVGYHIECDGTVFCFITDIGHITPTVCQYTSQAQYLIIEANYDEKMLMEGRYSYPLKMRIRGENGHLSNREAGEFLAAHYPAQLRHIWLCHLSKENNTHEKAQHAVEDALNAVGKRVGVDYQLTVLPRTSPSAIYEWE